MIVPRHYHAKRALDRLVRIAAFVPGAGDWSRRASRRLRLYAFDDTTGYFSQWGQDAFLDRCVFGGQRDGTFVDIGANDGVTCSNTYFFESARGWSGVCVEPQPEMFEKLRRARRCACVQGCAGLEDGEVGFNLVEGASNMLSGRADRFPDGHERRIAESIREDGGRVRRITVPCFEINALIRRHGITAIDLLSVDTEGGEADLIAAVDLDAFRVRAIAIENNYDDRRIEEALAARGFEFAAWMGSDEIYVRCRR